MRGKSWTLYLVKLRLKRNWFYELFAFLCILLCMIFSLIFKSIDNLSSPQPDLSKIALYKEANRLSYLSMGFEEEGGRTSIGYIEFDKNFYFNQPSNEQVGEFEKYKMDCASLLKTGEFIGRKPVKSGEAILGISGREEEFTPHLIKDLQNIIGLPTSYEIVGLVQNYGSGNTIFLSEEDLLITSRYQDYKNNLYSFDINLDSSNYVLGIDPNLKPDTIKYSGYSDDILNLRFFDQNRAFHVVKTASLEQDKMTIIMNIQAFELIDGRLYKTIVFDRYIDKVNWLERNKVQNIYDRFAPDSTNNMVKYLSLDIEINLILSFVLTLFLLAAYSVFTDRQSFNLNLNDIKVPHKLVVASDLLCLLLGSVLAIILGICFYYIYPLFFSPSTTLGYLGLKTFIFSVLLALLSTMTIAISRWRSHETA